MLGGWWVCVGVFGGCRGVGCCDGGGVLLGGCCWWLGGGGFGLGCFGVGEGLVCGVLYFFWLVFGVGGVGCLGGWVEVWVWGLRWVGVVVLI
uniref:Uncharacterized protein n=1 Tax=Knipowitschia caucasica TaxID=637954 RepID=A0AAV2MGA3_KNICA